MRGLDTVTLIQMPFKNDVLSDFQSLSVAKSTFFSSTTGILQKEFQWQSPCDSAGLKSKNYVAWRRQFPLTHTFNRTKIFTTAFKSRAKYSPGFRFTLMDLALSVLFHCFKAIFDRIRLTFSVATGTKSTNAIKYSCFHGQHTKASVIVFVNI